MADKKNLCAQIDIALHNRVTEEKDRLARETARTGVKLTQRDFLLGLIEQALAEAEASLAASESTEEAPEDSGAAGTTPDASEASAEAERDTADIDQ